jgi:hypothetical protein
MNAAENARLLQKQKIHIFKTIQIRELKISSIVIKIQSSIQRITKQSGLELPIIHIYVYNLKSIVINELQ